MDVIYVTGGADEDISVGIMSRLGLDITGATYSMALGVDPDTVPDAFFPADILHQYNISKLKIGAVSSLFSQTPGTYYVWIMVVADGKTTILRTVQVRFV